MSHLSEEDLILSYYGEADAVDEARMQAHLGSCAACRDVWQEIGQTLTLVDSAAVPEPPEGFERVMWARVQQALPQRSPVWTWRRLVPVLSFAAVVTLAVALGYQWRSAPVVPANPPAIAGTAAVDPSTTADPTALRERVLLTALDSHFEQTELLLIELLNAPEEELVGLGFERVAADDLLASGRLYRATAEQIGNVRFAQMLDDLEPVLVEVARSPERVDRREISSLRSRIDDSDLLFKVRAVTNDIRERQQEIVTANEGGQ
jgi:hypothetical protein